MKRIGLLPRILIAIAAAAVCGPFAPMWFVRVFVTLSGIFSQVLSFMIPLIIFGLVAPAIGDVGRRAGSLLVVTVALAYADTVVAGLMGYGVGTWLFPGIVETTNSIDSATMAATDIAPFFTVKIPPLVDVMSALMLAFLVGVGVAYGQGVVRLREVTIEFRWMITKVIERLIIPALPLYIFAIFLQMTATGTAWRIMAVFAGIVVVIFALHLFILLYQFAAAGLLTGRNPLKLLWTMLPAYMTALGTSSSAATIPVTLQQTLKNGVSPAVAGFTVPLCATIHMSGSAMKITACALTICLLQGLPHDPLTFVHFVMMLAVVMVAAPGVPGGAIMAALAPLASILGFTAEEQALMIALYIAMDSFGTACNVTGDGALAIVVDKYFGKKI